MNNSFKKKLPKEIEEKISGFEQLLEQYLNEEDKKENERLKNNSKSENYNYDLIDYLEVENNRLSKIENFFTKKIPIKINFSQDEKLLLIQKEKKHKLKEKILDHLLTFDSPLMLNASQMFNSHFS